jgi:hypothetical protein
MGAYNILSMLKHLTTVIARVQKQRLEVIYIFKQIYKKYKNSLVIDMVLLQSISCMNNYKED